MLPHGGAANLQLAAELPRQLDSRKPARITEFEKAQGWSRSSRSRMLSWVSIRLTEKWRPMSRSSGI